MKALIILLGLSSTSLIAAPKPGDCSEIIRHYNRIVQNGPGRVLLSSTENAKGTRLMQMDDYGNIKFMETACAPQDGQTVCSGSALISSLRTAAGHPFDPAAKLSLTFKLDQQGRLLVRSGSSSIYQTLTLTQCSQLASGAFFQAQAASSREVSLYQVLLRNVP